MIVVQIVPPATWRLSNKQWNQEFLCKDKSKAYVIGEMVPQGHQKFEKD